VSVWNAFKNSRGLIDFFIKELNEKPESGMKYNYLGEAYLDLKDYRNANICFQKVLAINPYIPGTHCNLGITYGMIGEYEKAIKYFEKAIEVDPDDNYSRENLATTYDMLADRDRGKKVKI
jgi:tetratricopeptide (TPR) repeat protein